MLLTGFPHTTRRRSSEDNLILRLLVLALALVGTFLPTGSAVADHECISLEVPIPGGIHIIEECPPHDGEGGGGGGEGDAPAVTCEQTYWPPGTEPTDDTVSGGPFLWYRAIEQREDGSIWGESFFRCTNLDSGEVFDSNWWVCYAVCGGGGGEVPEDVLDGLLLEAMSRVNPPLPGIRHTFDQLADDGTIRAVVNAETWWWSEADNTPIVQVDSDGPVWVRVTASPGPMTVDPGDGTGLLECPGLGVPYNREQSYWDQVPGEPRGACVHVYERAAEAVTATMTVTWMVSYEGFAPGLGNVSGALEPQIRTQTATFAVKEIQSVIVR